MSDSKAKSKGILEFVLPDDQEFFGVAVYAWDWYMTVADLVMYLRAIYNDWE